MKPTKLKLHPFRSGSALTATLVLASMANPAEAALHLAFGVDQQAGATFNEIRVRDYHLEEGEEHGHYHNFTGNNATAPGGHTPERFNLIPGSGTATVNLASMDISPDPSSRYTTNLIPPGDFHLELIGLYGVDADQLIVRFWHDDHTHTMSVGGDEHLEIDEINRIDFSLAAGAVLGETYSAVFRIVDEEGNYIDSPDFTIHVNAIPEPSAALLGATALVFGIARRKRR